MKSQIYRQAAILITKKIKFNDHSTRYCCITIKAATKDLIQSGEFYTVLDTDKTISILQKLFASYFKPKKLPELHLSYGWWEKDCKETDNQRVIALLLMEQIAKDL